MKRGGEPTGTELTSPVQVMAPVRVLMLLKTTGLVYDDRVRKEALSLQRQGHEVSILVVETENREARGVTDYGVPFHSLRLRSRGWSARGRGLLLKTSEMYVRMASLVARQRPDVVWLHNLEMVGLVPGMAALRRAGLIQRIVWDHHELPSDAVLRSAPRRRALGALMTTCDMIVMASLHRAVLWRRLLSRSRLNIAILDNLPDADFVSEPARPLPAAVEHWRGGRDFVLAQGGTSPRRHFEILCRSAVELGIPLVAVGRIPDSQRKALSALFGRELDRLVYFTGMVPQVRLVDYIDAAAASVVLYEQSSLNSKYCAPNRMYQALGRGTPVVVGANPGMSSALGRTGAGVVLQTDGRSAEDVQDGLRRFLSDRDRYVERARIGKDLYLWESQPIPHLAFQRHLRA